MSIQTHEPAGDISDLNPNTDVKQTCDLKGLPPQFAAGLDWPLRFSQEAPSELFPALHTSSVSSFAVYFFIFNFIVYNDVTV